MKHDKKFNVYNVNEASSIIRSLVVRLVDDKNNRYSSLLTKLCVLIVPEKNVFSSDYKFSLKFVDKYNNSQICLLIVLLVNLTKTRHKNFTCSELVDNAHHSSSLPTEMH
jgi:hypothetical protein